MLHWKLGKVREGVGKKASTITIKGIPFNWDKIRIDFEQYRNDIDFLKNCLRFRDGDMDGPEFFKYIKDQKRIFGRGLVLHVFLMHLMSPEKYPIIDQHVWRAMKVFHGNVEIPLEKPKKWAEYEHYRQFFRAFFNSLQGQDCIEIDKHTVDRSLMAFGKWIKNYRQ